MFSLNRATILGNLTKDPEVRVTPNGQSVASFSIATNRRWTTPGGEQQEDTQFHEIVAWGRLAEVAQQMLSKGKKAYIEGRIQTRTWDAADGSKRKNTEIVAENIIVLSPRQSGEGTTGDSFPSSGSTTSQDSSSSYKPKSTSSKSKTPTSGDSDSSFPGSDDSEIKLEDIPF